MNGSLKSLQLFIGILTGLLGLGAIAAGVGYYVFITQIGTRPPKPIFAEEREGSTKTALANAPVVETDLTAIENLTYDAKVTFPQGLSLRKEPNSESEKLGSVDFEAKVAIVKTSDDSVWVLIKPESDAIQGWVKAANIEKTAATDNPAADTPKQRAKVAENQEVKPRQRRKPAAESEEEATPKRTRRVKVNPDESPANNNEEAAPKRKPKVKVNPESLPNQESAPDPEPSSEPEKTN
jgi:hypothetical protein